MQSCLKNPSGLMRKCSHVIFDVDGLLLDTEKMYFETARGLVREYGGEYTWEARRQVMGMLGIEAARHTVELFDLPVSAEEFRQRHADIYRQLLSEAALMPGAYKLVKHLHNNHVPIAIATSSSQDTYEAKAKPHEEFFRMFHHVVCGGTDPEVIRGKPAPDIFETCARRFDPKPQNFGDVLVFEDAPSGVSGALELGMQVVMVPDPHINPELCKRATLTLKTLEDFQPEMFGLPSYNPTSDEKTYKGCATVRSL